MFFTLALTCFILPLLLPKVKAASSAEASPILAELRGVPAIPSPTASPLPPVGPFVFDLIDILATASYYSFLFANGID